MPLLDLPDDDYDLPRGKLATLVTFLEMHAPPVRSFRPLEPHYRLGALDRGDLAGYRALYRLVGEDWLWCSRLLMDDLELTAILSNTDVELFALYQGEQQQGLLELDFRQAGECELRMFGLQSAVIGKGLGGMLIDEAIRRAWARPISRFWVHTCSFDSPKALPFYIRSGFLPYKRQIEILQDPRLTGELPRTAAPQIPIIE